MQMSQSMGEGGSPGALGDATIKKINWKPWVPHVSLGRGAYGAVIKAIDVDTNRVMAVKSVEFESDKLDSKEVSGGHNC